MNPWLRSALRLFAVAPQQGAVLTAECLATGEELLVTPEHALHILEVLTAVRESSATGKRIALTSTFKWPIIPELA
jgi:predicted dehydrogenase